MCEQLNIRLSSHSILFFKDAKLGKKCTLLDLSRRPSVVTPEAQGAAATSSEATEEDSSGLPKPLTDQQTSNEKRDEEKKEDLDEKEKAKEELPTKMEVDSTDSPSDEVQSMTD